LNSDTQNPRSADGALKAVEAALLRANHVEARYITALKRIAFEITTDEPGNAWGDDVANDPPYGLTEAECIGIMRHVAKEALDGRA
jgi:hypothetical protein